MEGNAVQFTPLVKGDMVGDKPLITDNHLMRAQKIFDLIQPEIGSKCVIAVGGPSGSGKSEIGSILGTLFCKQGLNSYVLSCDNYPRRPPRENDALRVERFEQMGEKGLVTYLGTDKEIDFARLAGIVASFKKGASEIPLRIMNAEKHHVEDDHRILDCSKLDVLVLEGTWSHRIPGIDKRIFLYASFEETRAHRLARKRDQISEFGERVLSIEQAKLEEIAKEADLVIGLDGRLL